jgi:hypothetical protein
VLPKILFSFGLIPRHPHLESVVTLCNYVKGGIALVRLLLTTS